MVPKKELRVKLGNENPKRVESIKMAKKKKKKKVAGATSGKRRKRRLSTSSDAGGGIPVTFPSSGHRTGAGGVGRGRKRGAKKKGSSK